MHIGIDLGTTNSLAAFFRDGVAHLIPNAHGHVLTPSVVSMDEAGNLLVGLPARERISTQPKLTATAFKRWMGTDKVIDLGTRSFRAEELSAIVLKSLKADAESHLGEEVTEAVITVPAYFNEAQRRATKAAAELAGLRVDRLLNEPTAAGLAYGLQERNEHSTFLVFDLGGGTFDVSVLEYFDGVVEVRASAGDTRLGGEDFVLVLENLFLKRCEELKERERENLRANRSVWRAAEQAKRDLSDMESTVMRISYMGQSLEQTIRRDDFESASAELIARLRRPIERALSDAKLELTELSEVVLVGGATRMPLVRQAVTRLFQRLPLRLINPDETIARGAAIQAALVARNAALEEVVLTDVMPYSLGVVTSQDVNGQRMRNRFSPIIERNSAVPVSRVENYQTVTDNQTQVRFDIRQGESPIGTENLQLGVVEIAVPPMPAGHVSLDVRFSYDVNGLLEVDVKEHATGKQASTVIRQSADNMTDEQVAEARKRLAALKVHPRDQQENLFLLEHAKRLYEDRLGDDRHVLQHEMDKFSQALDTQDARTIMQASRDFRETLDGLDRGFVF